MYTIEVQSHERFELVPLTSQNMLHLPSNARRCFVDWSSAPDPSRKLAMFPAKIVFKGTLHLPAVSYLTFVDVPPTVNFCPGGATKIKL